MTSVESTERFAVPASDVEPWRDVAFTVDQDRLLATVDYIDESDVWWTIGFSVRARYVLWVDMAWGRHTDADRDVWIPAVTTSRRFAWESDLSAEPRLDRIHALASRYAAEAELARPATPGQEAQDRRAWAAAVTTGSPVEVPAPWEVPEVVTFVRSWISQQTHQLSSYGFPQFAPVWPAGWPPDDAAG